ncbi:MAG: insulinase family protein, partial [Sphingopyxis sp.]|nr:insulinase family protein [Sphingopyxis sp.]
MKPLIAALLAAPLLAWSSVSLAQPPCIAPLERSAHDNPCNPQTDAARAWGFDGSDLPVDADVRFGVLPNGMKYALHLNTTPRGGIAMRLRFDVGSLAENEDERGLAHFVEHMAFNGST